MISLKQQLLKYAPYVDSWDEVRDRAMIITGEQGYGDEMMFSHVLAHLRPMCRKLLVIASKPVQPLLQYNHPNIEFIGMGEPLDHRKGEFDGIATMADMFRAYVLQHRMAPPLSRYQAAHSAQYETAEKPKIAFVYRAGYDNVIRQPGDNATQRSISPMILQSLAADYDLYSFQVPVVETLGFVKQSLGSSFNTFLDTANALATMDMAISCDTAFAHLALAMGKPTIMVYDHYLDWRWKNNLYPAVNVTTTRQFDAAYVATIR
jgi:hypothetical protein